MTGREGDLWLCEGANAGPASPHHLRWLTDKGARLEGGPDTAALCLLRVVADVRAFDPYRDRQPGICCTVCLSALDSIRPRAVRAEAPAPDGVGVPALGRAHRLPPVTRLPRPGLRGR